MTKALAPFLEQVRFNCELASHRQSGLFSICGLALRLRDLYKWEHGLGPWEEPDPQEVLEWISKKEEYWEEISHMSYSQLTFEGREFSPFDTEALNLRLMPYHLSYGAGLGEGSDPSFFLGKKERELYVKGCPVTIVGREYARDLVASPAFSKGDRIVIRKEPILFQLWGEIIFATKEDQKTFHLCLREYGIQDWDLEMIKQRLPAILEDNIGIFIHHEVGEIMDTTLELNNFQSIIRAYQKTFIEYAIRALRDLMADTNEEGRFMWLIKRQDMCGLALSIAILDEFRKKLYKDIIAGFMKLEKESSWDVMLEAIERNRERGKQMLKMLLDIIEDRKLARDQILEKAKNKLFAHLKEKI
jgi:hypothetical protein